MIFDKNLTTNFIERIRVSQIVAYNLLIDIRRNENGS